MLSVPYGLHTIREVPLHLSREKLGVYTGYVVEKFRYIPNMITHLPRFSTGGFGGALYLSSLLFWVGAMLYFTQFPVLLKARGGFTTSGIYLMSIGNSAVSAFMYTRVGKKLRNGSGYGVLIRGPPITCPCLRPRAPPGHTSGFDVRSSHLPFLPARGIHLGLHRDIHHVHYIARGKTKGEGGCPHRNLQHGQFGGCNPRELRQRLRNPIPRVLRGIFPGFPAHRTLDSPTPLREG